MCCCLHSRKRIRALPFILTVEERAAVVTFEKERYRQRAIARKQKISLCAVQEIPKKKKLAQWRTELGLVDLA